VCILPSGVRIIDFTPCTRWFRRSLAARQAVNASLIAFLAISGISSCASAKAVQVSISHTTGWPPATTLANLLPTSEQKASRRVHSISAEYSITSPRAACLLVRSSSTSSVICTLCQPGEVSHGDLARGTPSTGTGYRLPSSTGTAPVDPMTDLAEAAWSVVPLAPAGQLAEAGFHPIPDLPARLRMFVDAHGRADRKAILPWVQRCRQDEPNADVSPASHRLSGRRWTWLRGKDVGRCARKRTTPTPRR
jgi:hypothetical protein